MAEKGSEFVGLDKSPNWRPRPLPPGSLVVHASDADGRRLMRAGRASFVPSYDFGFEAVDVEGGEGGVVVGEKTSGGSEANCVVLESKHPYDDYTNSMDMIELPGEESMVVWFDPKTKTEHSYDYVTFWDENKQERYGEEKYSGGRDGSSQNWPTLENPLRIPAGKCAVSFNSDGSNNDWGWKLLACSASEFKAKTKQASGADEDQTVKKGWKVSRALACGPGATVAPWHNAALPPLTTSLVILSPRYSPHHSSSRTWMANRSAPLRT